MTLRPRDFLPGLLVAATGVGAGDLITASVAGSELGVTIVWAAVLGAILKAVLNEGLARWQLGTGESLLDGWITRLPPAVRWLFLAYLLLWSFVVGGALVNACGIAASACLPLGDAQESRVIWGVVHSLGGLLLVRAGGFRLFESLMAACIVVMVVCVLVTAVLLDPDWGAVGAGIVRPDIPAGGLGWTLGVLGGVGGTVTLLSYGYWIREHGRSGEEGLRKCRIDLGTAYAVTALFGVAMIIIGSRLDLAGQGAGVAVALADELTTVLGPVGRWIFLVGFWGAVFSSLLGVWQGVPYLFADFVSRLGGRTPGDLSRGRPYRLYQIGLALLPLPLLGVSFLGVQLAYAVCGALFMPFLAVTLLVMNNREGWIGRRFRNGWIANLGLTVTVVFFGWQGVRKLVETLVG